MRSHKNKEDLIVLSIKTLAMATAISAGVVFAMPVASQAMPQSSPVKVDTIKNGNIVDAHYYKKRKWARYCRYHDNWRCYRRHRVARYRYYYNEPYYGYYPYPYGYYRPYYRPGIGLYFGIN